MFDTLSSSHFLFFYVNNDSQKSQLCIITLEQSNKHTGTKSLHKLDLSSNAITDIGASKIPQALSSCALQSLNLSGNSIKDDGATSLATALKQSSSVVLRTLHLERNPFTSLGCREIAKMARVNLSLKHLSFAHYVLDDSALQSLRVAFDFF